MSAKTLNEHCEHHIMGAGNRKVVCGFCLVGFGGGGVSQNYFSDKNSLLLKMNSWEANSHTDKAAQILWLMVLLWPWQQPTHSWEQLPTDSAINKWISYCYWGLSELTRGTDNFVCLFRKRTLYKRLVSPQLSTDISLLWNLSVEYFFFKNISQQCLPTKCFLLLVQTIKTSIIPFLRGKQKKKTCMPFLLYNICKHQHNPSWDYFNDNSICRSHIKKTKYICPMNSVEHNCRNT